MDTANPIKADRYVVMWERDTTGECPDKHNGNDTIINGSIMGYEIKNLEEDSTYFYVVIAIDITGRVISIQGTTKTNEAGEGLNKIV